MNNFVHDGHILELVAPYEIMNGDGLLQEHLFGIARSWARKGDTVSVSTAGVFDLKRRSEDHWDVGDAIYWNNDAKIFTRGPEGAVRIGVAVATTRGSDHPWVRAKLLGFVAPT